MKKSIISLIMSYCILTGALCFGLAPRHDTRNKYQMKIITEAADILFENEGKEEKEAFKSCAYIYANFQETQDESYKYSRKDILSIINKLDDEKKKKLDDFKRLMSLKRTLRDILPSELWKYDVLSFLTAEELKVFGQVSKEGNDFAKALLIDRYEGLMNIYKKCNAENDRISNKQSNSGNILESIVIGYISSVQDKDAKLSKEEKGKLKKLSINELMDKCYEMVDKICQLDKLFVSHIEPILRESKLPERVKSLIIHLTHYRKPSIDSFWASSFWVSTIYNLDFILLDNIKFKDVWDKILESMLSNMVSMQNNMVLSKDPYMESVLDNMVLSKDLYMEYVLSNVESMLSNMVFMQNNMVLSKDPYIINNKQINKLISYLDRKEYKEICFLKEKSIMAVLILLQGIFDESNNARFLRKIVNITLDKTADKISNQVCRHNYIFMVYLMIKACFGTLKKELDFYVYSKIVLLLSSIEDTGITKRCYYNLPSLSLDEMICFMPHDSNYCVLILQKIKKELNKKYQEEEIYISLLQKCFKGLSNTKLFIKNILDLNCSEKNKKILKDKNSIKVLMTFAVKFMDYEKLLGSKFNSYAQAQAFYYAVSCMKKKELVLLAGYLKHEKLKNILNELKNTLEKDDDFLDDIKEGKNINKDILNKLELIFSA